MTWPTNTNKARLTVLNNTTLANVSLENCEVIVMKGVKKESIIDSYFENCEFIWEEVSREVGMLSLFKNCTLHKCKLRVFK